MASQGKRFPPLAVLCAAAMVLGACVTAGPRRMAKDRFHYANSIGDTRETQALLNIVNWPQLTSPEGVYRCAHSRRKSADT